MNRKYVVKLNRADRWWLEGVVRRGRDSAAKIARARILLKSEVRMGGWSATRISEALSEHCTLQAGHIHFAVWGEQRRLVPELKLTCRCSRSFLEVVFQVVDFSPRGRSVRNRSPTSR